MGEAAHSGVLLLVWWNPLVYLLRRDLPQILEIRCDMAVTKDYTVSQKAEYLQTIVNSLKRMGKERGHVPAVSSVCQAAGIGRFPVSGGTLPAD